MLSIPFTLLSNTWRLIAYLWSSAWYQLKRLPRRHKKLYLELELEQDYPLTHSTQGLARYFSKEPSLWQLRDDFKRIRQDREVQGIILKLRGQKMGLARLGDVHDVLKSARHGGKHVITQAQSLTTRELLLASAGDEIVLTPSGRLYTFGLSFTMMFVKPLLDRLGLGGQFIHIGPFKTATHMFHKEHSTKPQLAMMEELHAGLSDFIADNISTHRLLPSNKVKEALAQAPFDNRKAIQLGLIDGEAFAHDIDAWIEETRLGHERAIHVSNQHPGEDLMDPSSHHNAQLLHKRTKRAEACASNTTDKTSAKSKDGVKVLKWDAFLKQKPAPYRWKSIRSKTKTFAILDLVGNITMEPGSKPTINPQEVIPALQKIAQNPAYSGLLLHINSSGGSALASDLMWREIQRLREHMPVVCYCTDIAASGGYYLAIAGDHIVCRPQTVTGSIGVITGKMHASEAAKKLGVRIESVRQDEHTKFLSVFDKLPNEAMHTFREDVRAFYRRFLDRVGQARHIERRRLHRYARGRVYLGTEAHARGLVDELGGLNEALAALAKLANVPIEHAHFASIPHVKKSFRSMFSSSRLQGHMLQDMPGAKTLEHLLLKPAEQLELLQREHMLAILPFEVTFDD